MSDTQKLFKCPNRGIAQRRILRTSRAMVKSRADRLQASKQAFLQHGLTDWHLPYVLEQEVLNKNMQSCSHTIEVMSTDNPDEVHQDNTDVMTAPPELKKPPFYAVVLFNDDYTPMEFVIEILQLYFVLDLDRATEVMLTVHYRGKGVAGTYPRDIAETKAQQVNNYARSQGHPLLCQIEPQPE